MSASDAYKFPKHFREAQVGDWVLVEAIRGGAYSVPVRNITDVYLICGHFSGLKFYRRTGCEVLTAINDVENIRLK